MRKLFTILTLVALSGVACSGTSTGSSSALHKDKDAASDDGATADAGNANDGGSSSGGAIEFTTFVRQLIENETADNNFATTIDDKTFADSEDPNAFSTAFFAEK